MVEELFSEAIRLLVGGGAPIWYVLAVAFAGAVLFLLAKYTDWTQKPSEPPLKPGLPVQNGEGGGVVDGHGNPVTFDPENPGGGPTGGMG